MPSLLAAVALAWRTRTASRRTDSMSAVAKDKLSLSRDIPEPIPDGRRLKSDPLKKKREATRWHEGHVYILCVIKTK